MLRPLAVRMLIPLHYSLDLDLDVETMSFSGRVSIDLEGAAATSPIELDSEGLTIKESSLVGSPVSVAFRGSIASAPPGLFRSGPFLATQLQPSSAPRLFSCIDDPAHKATFDLTVTVPSTHTVVTIAPLEREERIGDRKRFHFARSAPMPTFLFGLAAGPFTVEGKERVRVFSDQGSGLIEEAARCLASCEEILGTAYPWPKLDLVILPELGAAGLEMTSLIFLRESALVDPARLVAHEIAHQWFGCLVTPPSWDDLWLSEGFATWLASKAIALSDEHEHLASARARRTAMTADSLRSSRALRSTPANPGEIHELFDVVAYQKGAALLQMLEHWLGEAVFARAIRAYLNKYGQGHASSSDLWRVLEEESGKPVATVATQFGDRALVPALRFDRTGDAVTIEQIGDVCAIPVSLKLASSTMEIFLDSASAVIELPAGTSWLMGNAGAAGYYRCSYMRRERWPADALTGAEAITALCDGWDQLWLNESSVVEYLQTLEDLRGHDAVAEVAAQHVSELRDLLAAGESRANSFGQWHEGMALHPSGPAIAQAAWDRVKARSVDDTATLSFDERADLVALGGFADPASRGDIARFFTGRTISGGQRTVQQTLEKIDSRIAFRQREQLAFDAWLSRRAAPNVGADDALRNGYALLNAVAAGLHGALVHRMWTDGLGLTAPAWMQPVGDLRNALSAIERRLVAVFRGLVVIDEGLFDLSARIQEDLLASASLAEAADSPAELTALLARNAAVHDHSLRGAILFANVFGPEGLAGDLRSRLQRSHADRSRIQALLDRARTGEPVPLTDIRTAAAELPAIQRSQAADLELLGRRARGEK